MVPLILGNPHIIRRLGLTLRAGKNIHCLPLTAVFIVSVQERMGVLPGWTDYGDAPHMIGICKYKLEFKLPKLPRARSTFGLHGRQNCRPHARTAPEASVGKEGV